MGILKTSRESKIDGKPFKKRLISTTVLILTDIVVIMLSFWLAHIIRSEILPHLMERFRTTPVYSFSHFLQYSYWIFLWIFIFAYEKLYTKRLPIWEEVKVLTKSAVLSSSVIIIVIFITKQQLRFSRATVILALLFSIWLLPLFRYVIKILLIKTNLWRKNLLILGVHQTSLLIIQGLRKNRSMGYEIIGFLDDDPQKIGKKFFGVEVIGAMSDLEEISKKYHSKDIMVTVPHLPRRKLKELLVKCESLSDSMWLIPRTGDFITEGVEIEVLGEVLTLFIKKNLAKPLNIFLKRIFEVTLTVLLFILLMPLFLIITLAIKLDSQGPVLFVQKRFGQNKQTFELFKFRSMYVDGDKRLDEYFEKNPSALEEWKKFKKLKNHDPRVTRTGRIIRRYSLDELPQLYNVLTGEMSLVGPRPYLDEELEGRDIFKEIIAKVKPGITGLWQTSGRSDLSFEKRLSLDEYYVRNWSLWYDIVILLKSIRVIFSSRGAY
jgi:undecaprenyl-phosphate galactose phosphotransferase